MTFTVRFRTEGFSDTLLNVILLKRAWTAVAVAPLFRVITSFVVPVKVPIEVPPNRTVVPLTPI